MRSTILLLCLLSLSLGIKAGRPNDAGQDNDPKRWKTGFIVTLKGDTIHGKIKIIDFLDVYYDYQRSLSFKDEKGIAQYSPNDLNSFSYFEDQNKSVTLQSVSSPEGDGRVFLRLYYSGICKVYGFTITEVKSAYAGSGTSDGLIHSSLIPTERKYIQIGGNQFYPLKRIGFKKCMKEVFAACPRILSGLDAKEYTYDNLQALVSDYNKGVK